MTLCCWCEQPIREVLTPEGWEWEHVYEFAGPVDRDHDADVAEGDPRRHTR